MVFSSRLFRRRGLPAGDRANNQKRLRAGHDRIGQQGIRGLKRQILLAGEVSHVGPALQGDMVADRALQHRILRLECVENRALRDLAFDLDFHLARGLRERSQMRGQHHADHGSVWTSTESTAGRSRTMGVQESPALADTYTWPPVVPK